MLVFRAWKHQNTQFSCSIVSAINLSYHQHWNVSRLSRPGDPDHWNNIMAVLPPRANLTVHLLWLWGPGWFCLYSQESFWGSPEPRSLGRSSPKPPSTTAVILLHHSHRHYSYTPYLINNVFTSQWMVWSLLLNLPLVCNNWSLRVSRSRSTPCWHQKNDSSTKCKTTAMKTLPTNSLNRWTEVPGLPASHAWPLVLSPHSSLQWCLSYTPFDGFMMCCKHKVTE